MAAAELPAGFSRESGIRRDRIGRWFDEGVPVENPAVAQAFDRWVDRADDGRFVLRNSVNWVYVEIEGAPIFVRGVEVAPDRLDLELSDGRTEALDADTLRQDEAGVLHCDVRGGNMPASFTRGAQLQLEPLIEEDDQGVYIALGARRIRPPVVADPLAPVGEPAPPGPRREGG